MKVRRWANVFVLICLISAMVSCKEQTERFYRKNVHILQLKNAVLGYRWETEFDPDTCEYGQLIDLKWGWYLFYPWQGEEKLRCVIRGINEGKLYVNGKLVGYGGQVKKIRKPDQIVFYSGGYIPRELSKCHNLAYISTVHSYITDDDIRLIANARNLKRIDLEGVDISDEGYKIIARFKQLQYLKLGNTRAKKTAIVDCDYAVKQLSTLSNLQKLNLHVVPVTDEGLKYLADLKQLETMSIGPVHSSGDGFRYWYDCQNIKKMSLSHSWINDAGLKVISKIPNLTHLVIYSDSITDKGIRYLAQMPNLTACHVEGEQITSEGIDYLKGQDIYTRHLSYHFY